MAIVPVPAGRTSDLLIRQRLLDQLGGSQSGLLKLETQISSGQRLLLGSDDAPAALRALGLKQLLARKSQVGANLTINQSFLSATDSALSQVSGLLIDVRGKAQSVVGVQGTNDQRTAVAEQVHSALVQLINTGNQQFRGRYLFGGSRSGTLPFEANGSAVQFNGNHGTLASFADVALLFPTNADGDTVFGTLSTAVEGKVNLQPTLIDSTRLADLNNGRGVSLGKIAVSDGAATSTIDLSGAETIGDVISAIEHHAPAGRIVTATLTASGLNVSLDAIGGGKLTIREVAGSTTAADLGILKNVGSGVGPIVGTHLRPALSLTTSLDDILGTRAQATIVSSGGHNDLLIESRANGAPLNGVQVSFVANGTISAGNETVAYDANAKTLVFQIAAGQTSLNDIAKALNNDPQAGAVFRAQAAPHDLGSASDPTSAYIDVTATGTLADGSGESFDRQHGLQIASDGQTHTIDISAARTIEDLLNAINGSGAGALAEINASRTGINIRSRLSGADFAVGENNGTAATQLGVRSLTGGTRLEDLNHGVGVRSLSATQPDFVIRRKDGVELRINVSAAETIQDVIDLVNNHPLNQVEAHVVTARLAKSGNGIELVTEDAATTAQFSVIKFGSSQAAEDLGLIPKGASSSQPPVAAAGVETITGRDTNPTEVNGAFAALLRLEYALRSNDDQAIGRALSMLDEATTRVNLSRAEIGARQQGLDVLQSGLESEVTTLKSSLSEELDTDLPAAVSELAGRQASFQAALQTAAQIFRLTLLDFL